jgi:hypothetical protein
MIREPVIELFERVDPESLKLFPDEWTINGQKVTVEQRTLLESMTLPELTEAGRRSLARSHHLQRHMWTDLGWRP